MNISYNWLCSYLSVKPEPAKLAEWLTDCGLEVECAKHTSYKEQFKHVVTGRVLSCEKHPDADRLKVTTVDAGTGSPLQLVCGAPNVAAGQSVIVALPGANLTTFSGEKIAIKKSKIRGVESQGMICAEDELGMGKGHDGILVLSDTPPPGTPAATYFSLQDDTLFEIGLTPNRGDAASHIGVARDVAAVMSAAGTPCSLLLPDVSDFHTPDVPSPIKIEIEDITACPRYTGIVISDVTVAPSPVWLQDKLKSIGLNPINNIVDITNFILHETGQPLHAFDADKVSGQKVIIKKVDEGLSFETLDGNMRTLHAEDLMICNAAEPMCIAGVFGGKKSGVSSETKNIFLESAYFSPTGIRKTAKRHGLHTDASFRYERGANPDITVYALKRACLMIQDIAGGKLASQISDCYPRPIQPVSLFLPYSETRKLLGFDIPLEIQRTIFSKLEIDITKETPDGFELSIPPFKTDVTRKADVIEELARIYGYHHIPVPQQIHLAVSASTFTNKENTRQKLAASLSACGFSEILTNSLSNGDYYEPYANTVKVLHPLSSAHNTLRPSMLYTGLESVLYNLNRRNTNLKFYEFGKTYSQQNIGYEEQEVLSLFLTGLRFSESWANPKTPTDLYELKGYVENLFTLLGLTSAALQQHAHIPHPELDNVIQYTFQNTLLANCGQVNKAVCKKMDIDKPVFYAEVFLHDSIYAQTNKPYTFQEIPKHLGVRRDLAILLDASITFDAVKVLVMQTEKKWLELVSIFDVYEGKNIEKGKKSYALSFYLNKKNATLTDAEIEESMGKIQQAIETKLNGKIRS